MINKILKKLTVFVLIAMITMPFVSSYTFAAAKVTAEGGANVKVGDTFIVKVTYGGDEIGRVDGQLTYDTSKLEYISGGTSEGDTGYVQMKLAGTDGTITFTLKFKALEEGSTNLEITTNEIYDFAEIPLDNPSLSKNIVIGGGERATENNTISEEELSTLEQVPYDPDQLEESDDESLFDNTLFLIISAAVLVLLIIIISVVLRKRK